MLAVTEEAASAIEGILASPEVPDEASVRITTEIGMSNEGAPSTQLRFAVAKTPEPNDQVLDDAPVFLEPEAAALLDDKVLDAEVAGDQVHFDLKQQN
jgi:iron-sulfur cluster assembly protein